MEHTLTLYSMSKEAQNESVRLTIRKERKRLLDFIRRRVGSDEDAEDILQDVFYQFIAAVQLEPIERAAAWLYRVAGSRIIDWYRRRRHVSLDTLNAAGDSDGDTDRRVEDALFSRDDIPDIVYLRSTVWTLLTRSLNDLPAEQREVFILHELEGKSFKEIAEMTGTSVNTLLSRKRYAVLALRKQMQELYDDFFHG